MSKYKSFDELKRDRKELVAVARKNDMLDGLIKLLTELYPDKAHFIYELLQNAEDKEASRVDFILSYNRLVFTHNGKKRDFILDDIDAITNIGQSTKIDDPTAIGKFGVGFKAVYSYTNTPEIHSGMFDFKIVNMLVPDDEGVRKIAENGKTVFVFPFDNPSKPMDKAVSEISNGLLSLDENSIIFLRHIKEIHYKLPDGSIGGIKVKCDENDKHKRTVVHINAKTQKKSVTYWTIFSKDCSFDDGDRTKILPVSIAYRMKKVSNGEEISFRLDSELKGNVCIYFPAVKENSNLHFHINAPFASTVARDSVRFCEENELLLKEIAKVCVHSLYYFKVKNLLDMSAYATFPTSRDFDYDEDNPYYVLYKAIFKEFKNQEFILTVNGEYKKVSEVLRTNREINKLITNDEIHSLYKKHWVPAIAVQSREDYFFQDLEVVQFGVRNILDELKRNKNFFDNIFVSKTGEWFKDWYFLLSEAPSISYYVDYLKNVKMLKGSDDELYTAQEDVYLYNSNYRPKNIKNPVYIVLPSQNVQSVEKANKFLILLGLKKMSEEIDLFYKIDNAASGVDIDDVLLALRAAIDKFNNKQDISSFKNKDLFFARSCDEKDESIYVVKASQCCWSKEVLFFFQDNDEDREVEVLYTLAIEEYSSLTCQEKETLKLVFKLLGGKVSPEIYKSSYLWENPQFDQLNTDGERYDTCLRCDYVLSGYKKLNLIKEQELFNQSLILWDMLNADKNYDHHKCVYKANKNSRYQYIESRAAYYLSRIEWIPNKEGVFCRPCDITEDNLYDGFVYSKDAVFLQNIGFGNKSKAPSDIIAILKKAGHKISTIDEEWLRMSDVEKQEFIAFREAKIKKERERLSFDEALEKANKEQVPYEIDDEYGRDVGVKNVSKRQQIQRKEFEEGLVAKVEKQQVWHYTYVTKSTGPEKQYVKEQYGGKCQVCGRPAIIKANGQPYFEAINIIDTSLLDDKYLNNLDSGWNTLSLCPNCAAEYRYCQKNLNDFKKQVEKTIVEDRKNQYINIYIELKNEKTKITFTPRHFLALKTAFEIFRENEKKE